MAITFAPSQHHHGDCDKFDLRMRLVNHYARAKSVKAKTMAVDFRVHPDCMKAWGIRPGDRLVGSMEEDGSWTFTRAYPSGPGYTVRVGGTQGHRGRRGYGYFRFSMNPSTARFVFPDSNTKELELIGVEGQRAYFVTRSVPASIEFVPAS